MNTVIIGVDSNIGCTLYKTLCENRWGILGTTKRHTNSNNILYLNLLKPNINIFPNNISNVVFCAGITSNFQCEHNYEHARKINLDNTLYLAKEFEKRGAFVVVLSTNLVFDGNTAKVHLTSPHNPLNSYGQLKSNLEKSIRENLSEYAIVRLTKVLTKNNDIIKNWDNNILNNLKIHAFIDYPVAPLELHTVVKGIINIIDSRQKGIWQFSPNDQIAYSKLAKMYIKKRGINENIINYISAKNQKDIGHIPKYVTMCAKKSCSELDIQFPDINIVVNNL